MKKWIISISAENYSLWLFQTERFRVSWCITSSGLAFLSVLISTFIFGLPLVNAEEEFISQPVLESVVKVWSKAPHNAFTSLIWFKDSLYLTFREAEQHAGPNAGRPGGNIRILKSHDAQSWKTVTVIESGINGDLRDPHLSITPSGALMLNAAYVSRDFPKTIQSQVWISADGVSWSGPKNIGENKWWLWKIVWGPDDYAYSFAYSSSKKSGFRTRLYRSKNGYHYEILMPTFITDVRASETALLFKQNGQAVALTRRNKQKTGLISVSKKGYQKWRFFDFGVRIGGPELIELPSGIVIAAVRVPGGRSSTALFSMDPNTWRATRILTLPSGGDTGYPGMVWHNETLWVSYYSSHEGKASIYLAKIKFAKKRFASNKKKGSKPAHQDVGILNLRKNISELRNSRATLSIKYTDNHPDMIVLEQQILEIEKRINVLIDEAEEETQ